MPKNIFIQFSVPNEYHIPTYYKYLYPYICKLLIRTTFLDIPRNRV